MTRGPNTSDWYVIRTNPQCEKKATGELRRAGVRVYLPKQTYQARNRRTGVTSVRQRPLLVGYLFIRFMDAPDWFHIRQCQGVKDVLRYFSDEGEWSPLSIPSAVVASFMRRQRAREFDDIERKRRRRAATYKKGQKMRVIDGPFASFMATVDKLHKSGKVDTDVEIFGRMVRVSFEEPDDMLKAIAKPREAA